MIIKKLPIDATIKCSCGCEFEFHEYDVDTMIIQITDHEYKFNDVVCPYCKKHYVVAPIKEVVSKGDK